MYWIYDIPNWQFFLLVVGFFVVASVTGLHVTRPVVCWIVEDTGKHNDVANFFFAAVCVLYGLTLGLIAVGTWQNFSDADAKASKEANSVGELYRDLDGYPTDLRVDLEHLLRDYTKVVIEKEWPVHRAGGVLDTGEMILEHFENRVMAFEPQTETQKIAHSAVIKSLGTVIEDRGFRIQSTKTALPGVLWAVVLIGAAMNIGLTYIFWIENRRLHTLLVATFSASLGMLIFLTAAMDNPYRGEFSVSPESFQFIIDHVMTNIEK